MLLKYQIIKRLWWLLVIYPKMNTTSAICSHANWSCVAGTKIEFATPGTGSGAAGKPNCGEIVPPGAIPASGEFASASGGAIPGATPGGDTIPGAPNIGPTSAPGRGPTLSGNGMIGTISIGAAGWIHGPCGSISTGCG